MREVIVSYPSDAGQRLDKFLKKYLPNMPLGGIYKMLRTGKIKVNKKKKDQTYKIELGDILHFWLSDEELDNLKFDAGSQKEVQEQGGEKNRQELDILFEDEYLLVVNKTPGINVHPGDHKTQEVSLIELVQDYLGGRYDSLTFRPSLVHRIDRDTSGCILIAKQKDVLESLLSDLQNHQIEKIYHAIVVGIPEKPQGTIRDKILRIENAKNEAKVKIDPSGQSATTHYRVLATYENNILSKEVFSLFECRIETGRTHQIRVHLAHIGLPILGDKAYGNISVNSYAKREFGVSRQLLHAFELSFIHPKTKEKLSIKAPYPKDYDWFKK